MIESVGRLGSSGTYHVRATELAHDRIKTLSVTVAFLDDTSHVFHIQKRAKGQVLLDAVFRHLELSECHYFGLQYSDNGAPPSPANYETMRWLDPSKPVKKQMKGETHFYLRVKFYVNDPSKLQEEYTRYHFYLQVRKDIMSGRLPVPPSIACLLASYTVQSELGDYNPEEHGPRYLSGMALTPGQTEELETKIADLHKLHKGQMPADAEFNFLDQAKRLDMYGVDLHRAKDSNCKELQIGVTSIGLLIFHNGTRVNTFSWGKIVKISFKRKQFFIQLRREQGESYDTLLGFQLGSYRSCKCLWKACVEHHTFFRLVTPPLPPAQCCPIGGSRFSYTGRTDLYPPCLPIHTYRPFVRCPSGGKVSSGITGQPGALDFARHGRSGARDKVTSLAHAPRRAWTEAPFQEAIDSSGRPFSPTLPPRSTLSYVDDDPPTAGIYEISHYDSTSPHNGEDGGLVFIKMHADAEGRFGFNVKGGSDLGMAIVVSRVAPGTPADRCYPRLNEGDQVLVINGMDISGMTHEQVVGLIRASRETNGGQLVLTVRPTNVYNGVGEEEPSYQYVSAVEPAGESTEASLTALADGLASGALLAHFEHLYRRKPGMATSAATLPRNAPLNRYTDVLPYDQTRVILESGPNGDYINANYVNMEIPGSNIINRYIATQGPLNQTVGDFWTMVWESGSQLVVMVTSLVERGRVKCHKYWPNVGDTLDAAPGLSVKALRCHYSDPPGFIANHLLVSRKGEEREVTQLQYVGWPDHGVPDSAQTFLAFMSEVRRLRTQGYAAIVHCSAGIGRTGVLVLMETALCLIEAGQPVYPLQIVTAMRDQRAMMVQTPSQMRFVCTCILQAYNEGMVKPLVPPKS